MFVDLSFILPQNIIVHLWPRFQNRRSSEEETPTKSQSQAEPQVPGPSSESNSNNSSNGNESDEDSVARSEGFRRTPSGSLHGQRPRDEIALRRSQRLTFRTDRTPQRNSAASTFAIGDIWAGIDLIDELTVKFEQSTKLRKKIMKLWSEVDLFEECRKSVDSGTSCWGGLRKSGGFMNEFSRWSFDLLFSRAAKQLFF